jgi:hypothetical protein
MRRLTLMLLVATAPALVLPPDVTARICLCRGVTRSLFAASCEVASCCRDHGGSEGAPVAGAVRGAGCCVLLTTPHRDECPSAPAPEVASPPVPAPLCVVVGAFFPPARASVVGRDPAPPPDPAVARNLPRVV